jgi:HlyD family secretion protein
MTTKKKIIIIVIGIIIVAGLGTLAIKKNNKDLPEIQISKVKKGEVIHKVASTGKIQPMMEVDVSADVAGRVVKMDVKEGEWVEKGQFLAQLDATRYLADVERAEQLLMSAQATLEFSELEKNQQEELWQKKLVSELVYRSAKARYEQSLSQMRQAKASLIQAKDNYDKTRILAPMSGIITRLNKEEGEIALGSAFQRDIIMTVADLRVMEVLVEVNENDVIDIALNNKAEIEIDAMPDTVFYGVVTEIAHSARLSNTGSLDQVTNFEVKIRLDNVPKEIRPGMSAALDIITKTKTDVTFVPIQCVTIRDMNKMKSEEDRKESRKKKRDALKDTSSTKENEPVPESFKEKLEEVVFVVVDGEKTDSKKVEMRIVKTGITGESDFEIISGLEEGEDVVSGPYRMISRELKPDMDVKVGEKKRFTLEEK